MVKLNEGKVIFIGDGATGKSSLIKRMNGDGFDQNKAMTPGMEITKTKVNLQGEESITAKIWDLGGQEIYHAAHQNVITQDAVYILVLTKPPENKTDKKEYWINQIRSFGGKESPIIIVCNKIDQDPLELNKKFLKEKYPNIKGFYSTSCKENTGTEDLKTAITEELIAICEENGEWDENWIKAKEEIEAVEKYTTQETYRQICDKFGLQEKDKNELLEKLQNLGSIMEIEAIDNKIFNPEWAMNALYSILNAKSIIDSNGILNIDELPDILDEQKYPTDTHEIIKELIIATNTGIEKDEDTLLIPAHFNANRPEYDFDYKNSINLRIKYKSFIPISIISQVIAEKYEEIKEKLYWKTGMILENNGVKVEIDQHINDYEIQLQVYGDNNEIRKKYISEILGLFAKINDTYDFDKNEIRYEIAPPENKEVYISIEHLRKLHNKGIIGYQIDGMDEDINPTELLSLIE